jgi:diguanylate cyclase (GGDEF)-like protein
MTSEPPLIAGIAGPPVQPTLTLLGLGADQRRPLATPAPAPATGGLRGGLLVAGSLLFVALIALLDCKTGPHLSLNSFYLIPVGACAWWGGLSPGILLALAGAVAGHVVDIVENPAIPFSAGVWNGVIRFGTLTLVSSLVSRLHAGVLRERHLARTDPLTGAANARTFYEAAAVEAERARRVERPLTIAYFDLDNFKQLNDRLGHAVGDEALSHVVRVVHLNLSDGGLLARLGGDEFALLLPETEAVGAIDLLGRLQEILAQEMALRGWPVTLSVGAVTFVRPPGDVDLMVRRVDALMYGAKRKGKGRVEHATVQDIREWHTGLGLWTGAERRATARAPCNRAARVRPQGQGHPREECATLRNISAGGLALHLGERFPRDTVLVVEAVSPGPRTLLVRVVRSVVQDGGWLHGCVLSNRLSAEDLCGWLGNEADSHRNSTAECPPIAAP